MSLPDASTTESAQKREAILRHAIATFASQGVRNADVQVIADKAGVGKGTVYRYFGNKEELFWSCTMVVLGQLEQHLGEAVAKAEGAVAKLRAAALAYARFFEANPQFLEMFVQERAEFRGSVPQSHIEHHEQMIRRYARIVEEGIATGELRPVDIRKTILALGGLLYGTVVHACYANLGQSLSESVAYAADIFLEGISKR